MMINTTTIAAAAISAPLSKEDKGGKPATGTVACQSTIARAGARKVARIRRSLSPCTRRCLDDEADATRQRGESVCGDALNK